MSDKLLYNINKIHTSEMGVNRVKTGGFLCVKQDVNGLILKMRFI